MNLDLCFHSAAALALLFAWAWHRACRKLRALRRSEALLMIEVGALAGAHGRRDDAVMLVDAVLQRARTSGDGLLEGLAHECLGDIALTNDDGPQALHHWRTAALVLQTWAHHADAARVCGKLAQQLSRGSAGTAKWTRRAAVLRQLAMKNGPIRSLLQRALRAADRHSGSIG